jgi:DNA topoisomerase-3
MPPIKVLNVAEKNDAAKNIAAIMSGGGAHRREGFSVYNKIYEFGYMVQGQEADMVMTSLSGHLLNMEFDPQYRKWHSCPPLALFTAPMHKGLGEGNSSADIKRTLEREARGAKLLIIWTDCDREGENIGMEVVTVCQAVNRGLRVLRAKFSEITRPSIERAMATLGQLDQRVSDAVDARQELDLRIGAAFTRCRPVGLMMIYKALQVPDPPPPKTVPCQPH